MNAKALLAMIVRLAKSSPKNATLAAGVLIGLALAVQFPALIDSLRAWVKEIGLGGIVAYGVSLWLSQQKAVKVEKRVETVAATALSMTPPESEQDANAAMAALKGIK